MLAGLCEWCVNEETEIDCRYSLTTGDSFPVPQISLRVVRILVHCPHGNFQYLGAEGPTCRLLPQLHFLQPFELKTCSWWHHDYPAHVLSVIVKGIAEALAGRRQIFPLSGEGQVCLFTAHLQATRRLTRRAAKC